MAVRLSLDLRYPIEGMQVLSEAKETFTAMHRQERFAPTGHEKLS